MTIVRVRNLDVTLDHHRVLRDVNFEVDEGETIAIVGPNGSGKTVLLRSLLGMLPYTGEITWREDVTIGYVPQKIDADRSVPLNAGNLLRAKAKIIGAGADDVARAIARVGLTEEILTAQIGKLSGGQFQRMLVAFALLGDPDIILFDEPTASLDEPGEEQVYELMRRLQKEMNITAIVVSHDQSFVDRYASRVLTMNCGTLTEH